MSFKSMQGKACEQVIEQHVKELGKDYRYLLKAEHPVERFRRLRSGRRGQQGEREAPPGGEPAGGLSSAQDL